MDGAWALAAAVVFSGLWSGLMGMQTLVLQPVLAVMDARDFDDFLRAFLRTAGRSWFNYVCWIGMAVAPIAALVLLRDEPGSASFVLTSIGLGLVIVGVFVVSNVWKEPHYAVMLAWDPEDLPRDWEVQRRRYFMFNWIQLAATWTAFALFLIALVSV